MLWRRDFALWDHWSRNPAGQLRPAAGSDEACYVLSSTGYALGGPVRRPSGLGRGVLPFPERFLRLPEVAGVESLPKYAGGVLSVSQQGNFNSGRIAAQYVRESENE